MFCLNHLFRNYLMVLVFSLFLTGCGGASINNQGNSSFDPVITAAFSAYPLHGAPSLAVAFTSITTGDVSSVEWDFGDGSSSTVQSPTHTYTQAGTYSVVLTISNPKGTATKTQTDYITVAATISANTFYVDQNHASANDSNDGTEAAPWLTIQHAANTVQAGDTVIVKTGTYDERITFASGITGAPGNRITFRAEPRRTVDIWGFYTANTDYLRIEGFNITTSPTLTGWTDTQGIFIRSDYVEIVDNYFYEVKAAAVQAYWGTPWPKAAYVADNRIYQSQKGVVAAGADWLIENNEVERLFDWGNGDADYSRFFGENIIFRNNYFHSTLESEIGAAHVDGFQTFDNNNEYARNILIEGNVVRTFHQGFMGEARVYGNSADIIFRNNIFTDSWSWGLDIVAIKNVIVVHNIFANMTYHGVGFKSGGSGVVKNNIFYNAGSNYWADDQSTVEGGYNLLNIERYPNYIEATDIVADPLFVNPASYDFSLQASSPAMDAGVDVGVSQDISGTSRPQGSGVDIGAYEYVP